MGHTWRAITERPWVVAALIAAAALLAYVPMAFADTPGVPGNLSVRQGTWPPVIATLEWTPPADSTVVSYRIYVIDQLLGPYSLIESTAATSFDFYDGLGGRTYYFRVTAVDDHGDESAPAQSGPVTALWSGPPHGTPFGATSQSCWMCHPIHRAVGDLVMATENTSDTPTQAGACYVCHNGQDSAAANVRDGAVDSFGLPSGHSFDATATQGLIVTCSSCHQVHGNSYTNPMLIAPTINGISVASNGPAVCYACHDALNSWYGSGYPGASSPERDAYGYPVAGTWLGRSIYEGTSNAHRLIPETSQTIEVSNEVRREPGDCLYCHAAHRGPNAYDSLVATFRPSSDSTLLADRHDGAYAALCFRCHGGATPSGFTTPAVDIKQFATASRPRAGHRVVSSGGDLPAGAPLPCYECHNPHGTTRGNASMISDELGAGLDTGTDAGVRQFCFTCHTTSGTGRGWDSDAGVYAAVPSTATIAGLSRTSGFLILPGKPGHAQEDTASCYDCHGNNYTVDGFNVHNPGPASYDTTAPTTVTADLQLTYVDVASIILLAADNTGGTGVDATYYVLDGGPTVTGTTVTAFGVGLHSLLFWSVDMSGNAETPTSVSFNITDGTAPTTTSDVRPAYTGSAEIRLTAVDPYGGSGVADTYYKVDHAAVASTGTVVMVDALGDHTLEFWSVDNAGNIEGSHTETFTVTSSDVTPPTTSADYSPVYSTTATVTLTALDNPGGSGVAYTRYVLDGGTETSGTIVTASSEGMHTIEFWSADHAGNIEAPTHVAFLIDYHAPTTTSDAGPSYDNIATISLTATDTPSGSGVGATYFRLDGGTQAEGKTVTTEAFGPHTLEFWSVDVAGNIEATRTASFDVRDTIPASGSITIGAGASYTATTTVTLTLSATDAGSGVAQMEFSDDGTTWKAPVAYATSYDYTLPSGDGAKTVYVRFIDGAGNTGPSANDSITLDTTGPTGSVTTPPSGSWLRGASAAIAGTAADGGAGVAAVQLMIVRSDGQFFDGVNWNINETWLDAQGTTDWNYLDWPLPASESFMISYDIWVRATDAVANQGTLAGATSLRVDNVAPTGAMHVNANAAYATTTTAAIDSAVADGGSGVTSMSIDPGSGTFGAPMAYSTTATITLPPGDGPKTVQVRYYDAVGNSVTLTDVITLDTTAPTGTMSVNAGSSATSPDGRRGQLVGHRHGLGRHEHERRSGYGDLRRLDRLLGELRHHVACGGGNEDGARPVS